jgi:uncharacterized repeat protein (TIGR02543 family)
MRTLITSLLLASSITSAIAATTTSATATTPAIAEIQTNVGTITTQLNWAKAPISSQNFVNYANKGFYKGIVFHRAIKDFMLQTGGVDVITGQFKTPDAPITSESDNGLTNLKYTLAMARATDPNSATSQFFINTKDNAFLDKGFTDDKGNVAAGYTVFSEIISGKEVVDKINAYLTIKTGYSGDGGVPVISDGIYECGINFCLKKIYIENVYTSNIVDSANSFTRVTVNGYGKVTSNIPGAITCGTGGKACTLKKPFNTDIKLIATPVKGYEFKGWSGDCSGTTTPLVLDTKTKNNNCTATFAKIGA